VLGDRTPTVADVPKLTYAKQVFEEALRLYPPVHGIPRDPVHDDVIGGYRIPAGSTVTISTYLIHRNPRLWDDPDGFDPDRFGPDQPPRHQFAYLPFGAGGRKCIGGAFAMMEGTLAITMIAQALRPTLVPGLPVVPDPRTTFRPASIPVRLRLAPSLAQQQPEPVEQEVAT
jgi:enediyne biosynthesis protein E7